MTVLPGVENPRGAWYRFVMDISRNKAVVAQFDELGNSGGDLAILDTLCTPDMVNHALAAGRPIAALVEASDQPRDAQGCRRLAQARYW